MKSHCYICFWSPKFQIWKNRTEPSWGKTPSVKNTLLGHKILLMELSSCRHDKERHGKKITVGISVKTSNSHSSEVFMVLKWVVQKVVKSACICIKHLVQGLRTSAQSGCDCWIDSLWKLQKFFGLLERSTKRDFSVTFQSSNKLCQFGRESGSTESAKPVSWSVSQSVREKRAIFISGCGLS